MFTAKINLCITNSSNCDEQEKYFDSDRVSPKDFGICDFFGKYYEEMSKIFKNTNYNDQSIIYQNRNNTTKYGTLLSIPIKPKVEVPDEYAMFATQRESVSPMYVPFLLLIKTDNRWCARVC